ncbi:MAG: queuosine precursor transporter [Lachnospiraceae bacterium]|nr:queuosine precursor transporter [Lachnospiraceae bacterium]
MSEKRNVSQIFCILCGMYVTCLLLSNLIAGKMWAVSEGITLPAAVILFPLTYILSDVFTEVYGFEKTRGVIWMGFVSSLLAVLVYMAVIALPSPSFWQGQEAFETVLGTTPRVALASFCGYLFGEFSNSIVLSKLKVATEGRKLWFRTIGSSVVGELFDSAIFITISFWGTMENSVVLSMILYQYLFKVGYEVLFTPLTYFVIGKLKKAEGVDVYDSGIKYSVFGKLMRKVSL